MSCEHCKQNEDKEKHRIREEKEKKALMNRISRIEGQLRGVKLMIEEERYCVDIMTQISAVSSALGGLTMELMASHIKGCVVEEIQAGDTEAIDELCVLLRKLLK